MRSAGDRKSVGRSRTLLDRPSGGLSGFIAHGRSPGLQRIADAAFPDLTKSPVARSAGTPLTVAGAATDWRKPTVFPFHPRSNRGTVLRFMSQLREGLSNGTRGAWATLRSWRSAPPTTRGLRRGRLQTSKKIGPDFGGQLSERFGGRTSRPEGRSKLPQRCNFGFRQDGAPGRDRVLPLRRQSLCAEQRFGESALHFLLQQGHCIVSGHPRRSGVGRTAKFGANLHEVRGANDSRRANSQRGQAPQEATPRNNNRTHHWQSTSAC
jgi:hypothetical protein